MVRSCPAERSLASIFDDIVEFLIRSVIIILQFSVAPLPCSSAGQVPTRRATVRSSFSSARGRRAAALGNWHASSHGLRTVRWCDRGIRLEHRRTGVGSSPCDVVLQGDSFDEAASAYLSSATRRLRYGRRASSSVRRHRLADAPSSAFARSRPRR